MPELAEVTRTMVQLRKFLTLTWLSALEAVRQPITLLLTVSAVVVIGIVPVLMLHQFGEEGKLARDSGLACQLVFGLFLAGYAAASTLSREIRSGTVAAVLCKPVSRELLLLAKFTGVCLVVLAFCFCTTLATLLAERVSEKFVMRPIGGFFVDYQTAWRLLAALPLAFVPAAWLNYRKRKPFESTAFFLFTASLLAMFLISGLFDRYGQFAPWDLHVDWRIVPAALLIALALLVFTALAVAFSARLDTVPTLICCCALLLAGLTSDYLLGRYRQVSVVADGLYRLLPNWQHFWALDALTGGGRIPFAYLGAAGIYALAYGLGVLCLGMAAFRGREIC